MLPDIVLLFVGFVLLIGGGELLVRGSVAVAERLGVSPLIIGIVLVGFGTSTPELVISLQASFAGSPGIAIGNFVGSNIANVLLIIGASALVTPLVVSENALKRDGTAVVLVSIAFVLLALVMPLSRPVGAMFLIALVGYLWYACRQEQMATAAANGSNENLPGGGSGSLMGIVEGPGGADSRDWRGFLTQGMPFLMALAGLVVIIVGGRVLIDSAVSLARSIGVTEAVIGLTIVAVGTSLPELATSFIAARKGQADVAVGNVLGSNLYNILGIGGVVGLIAPTAIPAQIVSYDNFVMLAAAIAFVAMAMSGGRITRWEGAAMLAAYAAYIWTLYPH